MGSTVPKDWTQRQSMIKRDNQRLPIMPAQDTVETDFLSPIAQFSRAFFMNLALPTDNRLSNVRLSTIFFDCVVLCFQYERDGCRLDVELYFASIRTGEHSFDFRRSGISPPGCHNRGHQRCNGHSSLGRQNFSNVKFSFT